MKKKTTEEFIQEAQKKFPNLDYSQTIYTGQDKPISIICPEHGEQIYIKAGNFLRSKYGCKKCGNLGKITKISVKTRMSTEEFIKRSISRFGNKYSYDKADYKNNDTKVIITCPIHGDFEIRPGDFLRQTGCPKCRPKSLKEIFIEDWLKNNNINYLKQFCITLSNGHKAFIDFVINGVYVEYNGIQHYKDVQFFKQGGHNKVPFDFIKQQERDKLVNEYCKINNIPILWLNYKQNNSEIIKEIQNIL